MKRYVEQKKIRIIKVIDTKHSVERYAQRYDSFSKEQIDSLVRKAGKQVIKSHQDKTGNYGWHSMSTGAGGVFDWRPDTYTPRDERNHAIIVSLFPPKPMHHFNRVNAKIIVENHVEYWAVKELGMSGKFVEALGEPESVEYLEDELPFYITFFEGKLHDLKLDGYIVID